MTLAVRDYSSAGVIVARIAQLLGRSPIKLKIFRAVYKNKQAVRSVDEIVRMTRLDRKTVLTVAKSLSDHHVFDQEKASSTPLGYRRIREVHANKEAILREVARGIRSEVAKTPVSPRTSASLPTRQPERRAQLIREALRGTQPASIGILTALSKEAAAIKFVSTTFDAKVSKRGKLVYDYGSMPALDGEHQFVHVCLHSDMGTNSASVVASRLLDDHPKVRLILVCGIAGGCPNPSKAAEHVRLGDVVVSSSAGVIQYDNLKLSPRKREVRDPPRPPAKELLDAHGRLEMSTLRKPTWIAGRAKFISKYGIKLGELEDVLDDFGDGLSPTQHPQDPNRMKHVPRVFSGAIGSGNALVKDPVLRDHWRKKKGVRAFEMEAAGAAQAAWTHGKGYFVVRAVVDYCNPTKNDSWHRVGSINAALYLRALLSQLPC